MPKRGSPDKTTNELCPECAAQLHIRTGKQGPFWGCSAYPKCQYLRPLHEKNDLKKSLTGTNCPECSAQLSLKQGSYGLFVGCSNYPSCHYTTQLSEGMPPQKNNNLTNKTAQITCPSCKKGSLLERFSRFGKRFYACDTYPSCKYVINDQPINKFCPSCHWGILIKRKTTRQTYIMCPQKHCFYKIKAL